MEEIVNYFKGKPAMLVVFKELLVKYRSHGAFTGTIAKAKFAKVDLAPLLAFIGITDWQWQEQKSLSVKKFVIAYEESRFADVPLIEVVERLLGQQVLTKESIASSKEQAFNLFQREINNQFPKAFKSLTHSQWRSFYQQYQLEPANVMTSFKQVAKALDRLPKSYTKIPLFAYEITGNPHAFDSDRFSGQLLLTMLSNLDDGSSGEFLTKVEREQAIYGRVYLLKDDIMNFVAISGLLASDRQGEKELWRSACEEGLVWNVPVKHLLSVAQVYPKLGKTIFLIENSGVFSIVSDIYPELPLVCTNGQFRYAVWLLLELLLKEGDLRLAYSGDLDPEGLLMADKLKQRYGQRVTFLGMTRQLYRQHKQLVPISEQRLKKLNKLIDSDLKEISLEMILAKKAVYQEGILPNLLAEIAELIIEE